VCVCVWAQEATAAAAKRFEFLKRGVDAV